jgi:hypothetical protein
MRRFYSVRLTDVFAGNLSWAELGDLVDALPPESAFRTKIRDELGDEKLADLIAQQGDDVPHGPWSKAELLLASVIFELRQLSFIQLSRGGVKDLKPPEPVRTPGHMSASRRRRNPELVAELEAILAEHDRNQQGTG